MERCAICGRRAERRCPASGVMLCSACCGSHRGGFIRCPPDCPYLVAAERHLRARRAEELAQAWEDWQGLLEEQEMEALLPYLELLRWMVAQHLHRRPAEDALVQSSLEYLARRLSPIEVLEPSPPELGELLVRGFLPLVEQGRVDPDRLREASEALAAFVELFSREDDPSRFVRALLGTYTKVEPSPPSLILHP